MALSLVLTISVGVLTAPFINTLKPYAALSEYIEGDNFRKTVEIYRGTDNEVNLVEEREGYVKDDISSIGIHSMDSYGHDSNPVIASVYYKEADSHRAPITIAQARAKADNEVVTVEGVVIGKGSKVFIKDSTAAINLYTQADSIQFNEGDKIRVTGSIKNYNELLELTNYTVDEVISSGNPISASTITLDQIGEAYESEKIILKGVKIGAINTSGNTTITDSMARSTVIYKVPAITDIFEGDTVDVTAFVTQYRTTYQLYVNNSSDIVKSQIQPVATEPVFYGIKPSKAESTYDLRPEISIKFEQGEKSLVESSVEIKLDNILVEEDISFDSSMNVGTAVYKPQSDLSIGEHEVSFAIRDTENKEYVKQWFFTIIENVDDLNAYFGVPHSHTSFSDGQGTPLEAYQHAYDKGLDFLIVTDHSNLLDGDAFDSTKNQFTPLEGSEWVRTKEMADQFNSTYSKDFLAMRGFEWTHGSMGHMNALNSMNYTEAKKTMTELGDFYDWLGVEGVYGSFNHPNWPSDSFNYLAYDEDADRWVKVIEAGNGAPPYSYSTSIEHYYRALDNGWHVGAVNAQDNHSENWGDPDNLTGVLADELTEEAFSEAIKLHRVYSTETRDLTLKVKANGYWMGSILDLDQGESLCFDITASDVSDPIEKVELITNGGKVIATQNVNAESVTWTPSLVPNPGNNWYVVKVLHQNGKIGISSPVWTTGDENDLKLTELKLEPQPALPGVVSSIQATVSNFGARTVNNIEVKFYQNSVSEANLIGTDIVACVEAGKNRTANIEWMPPASGELKVIAKLTEIPGITTVTELSNTILVVSPINKKVLVDQYHGNADVPGTVGSFIKLLRTYGYKAELSNKPITEALLAGSDVLVLGAPDESKALTVDENNAVANWVKSGGAILVADKSNYAYNNMLLNPVMEAMGSSIRFNDDNIYEPETSDKYSGGMVWSVYMGTFPYAPSGLNKNMNSLRIFSGCSLVNQEGGALSNNEGLGLEILLCGNDTSYNYEDGMTDQSKGTVLGANGGYAHIYNEKGNDKGESIPVIAKEQVGNGKLVAAGRHFYSDFEIVNDASNTSFTLNLVDWLAGYDRIKDISWVRENAQPGTVYTVKGTITAPTNLFYDSMYIQDETGGICLYGNQKAEFRLGDEIIATGVVKEFEGEIELSYQDFTYDVLYIGSTNGIQGLEISTKDVAEGTYTGALVTTEGTISEINKPASYFKINEGSGTAYIHVDGYLGIDINEYEVGNRVKVTGIASLGAVGPRIRVRYANDIVKNEISEKHIIIVHTNDTHGRVEAGTGMGFARINSKIKELKENNPGRVLVLDAGDTLHGQTILSISEGESMVEIMNLIGYDAMAAGNHDFNYGQDRLLELEGLANFPILAANVLKADGTPLLTPYIIKELAGVKVAIFGLATPETLYKTHPDNVQGLTFKDPVATAGEMVKELKDKADVIIALSHLGLDEGSEVKSSDIAAQVKGIDIIIDGHSHTVIDGGMKVNNTTITQAGEYAKYVGIVDLKVGDDKKVSISAQLLDMEEADLIPEDQQVLDLLAEIKEENSVITSEVVGNTDIKLDGERNHVRSNETNLGNLIADAMKAVANADIALTNGGGIRASINIGEITKGEIITVLPFGNFVVSKEVSGADIMLALENGFSKYPAYDGRFPHISGMRVVFNPTKPEGSRVVEVCVGNAPLDVNRTYKLATNDFLAAGGDQYTVFADNEVLGEFGTLEEVVSEYIKTIGMAGAKKDGRVKVVTGTKIAVFSDPHYFAPELGTEGVAFEEYLAQDRKLIAESSAITRATVDKIKAGDANIVLIPGDLTKDGEKLSHEQFVAIIGELEDAGKKVYVIGGNHDINNPQANQYIGDEALRTENITPEDFKTIYNNYGYGEAIKKDTESLSYVVEPVPGLWVIAIDTCKYKDNDTRSSSETGGELSGTRYEWVKQQLIEAEAEGKFVIGIMHHGLMEHFKGQKQLFSEYVVENWEEVSEELADLGMKAIFTGHYHAQDIVSKTTALGNTIYDIETGALVTYPCPIRIVDISTNGMTVCTENITDIYYDTGDKTFPEYAQEFLKTGLEGIVPNMLAGQLLTIKPLLTQQEAYQQAMAIASMQPAPEVTSMTIGDLLVDAMMKHYQGDEKATPEVMAVAQGMASSSDPVTGTLGSVLLSLYSDLSPQDNNTKMGSASTVKVDSVIANPGKDVQVKLTMSNIANLAGLKTKLTYDPTKLSVKNVRLSPDLGGVYAINDKTPGVIVFNTVNTDGIEIENLEIATVTLSVYEECAFGKTEIDIMSIEACDCYANIIPINVEDGTITVQPIVLPIASNVTYTGEAVVGQLLTVQYDYFDASGKPEFETKIRWLSKDDVTGNYVEITGAIKNTLQITKDLVGKRIIVEVTPSNGEDIGLPVRGHNGRDMVIGRGDVDKNGFVSFKDALIVLRSITGNVILDPQAYTAAKLSGSDEISVNDVVKILRADVGLIELD